MTGIEPAFSARESIVGPCQRGNTRFQARLVAGSLASAHEPEEQDPAIRECRAQLVDGGGSVDVDLEAEPDRPLGSEVGKEITNEFRNLSSIFDQFTERGADARKG